MNQLMLELYQQALEFAYKNISKEYWNTDNFHSVVSGKFAELIVRECINEIAYIGKANEVFGDRTDKGGLNHILWTTDTAIEKIREHFGVEE